MSTKTNKTVSAINNNNKEVSMVNLLISVSGRSTIITLAKLNSRNLYKALRDEKFLPSESVGKTSSEVAEDGKAIVVSYKDIEVEVQVLEDSVKATETFLEATPEQRAKASGQNFGVTSSFGIVAKGEIFFMEYDKEEDKSKMVGADVHTSAYLAQLEKRTAKRAEAIAKNKEFYNKEIIKDFKKAGVDVAQLEGELLQLVAESVLDLEETGRPSFTKENDEVPTVKVKVQRKSEKTGNWYNAKEFGAAIEFNLFAEEIFDLDDEGNIIDVKYTEYGQTVLSNILEQKHDLTCVHSYNFYDKELKKFVFKVIDQRFVVSGKVINSKGRIGKEEIVATQDAFRYGIDEYGNIVESFQAFGFDNLLDIGEGFFLMPNSEEMYGADIEEKEYNEGIMYGTSKATVGMSVNHMAKEHIAKENKEAEVLEKVIKQARRLSNGYKNTKEALFEEVKNSSLYHWALEMEELTFKARKDAKLQNELNAKFEAMADEADDLLKVLEVLKAETGKGFAYPSYQVIKSLSRQPKVDSTEAFKKTVEQHIIENIELINKNEFDFEGAGTELIKEILETCRKAKDLKLDLTIKKKSIYFKMVDMVKPKKDVKAPATKVTHGQVKKIS